ncbi:NUDIX hydrolase [Rhodobacter sp. Har01]|uniref:NUDIX hydrolase n=1 Tax=Rhodobacter sp. Har01 TaxID=2883999 RepID=UPI001D08A785|nr:NUDIX hydrolase [Rhodobacter sp. Har01]MCB6178838.1 NUDIX hydrolase [Rhodobacter sp. Har01]
MTDQSAIEAAGSAAAVPQYGALCWRMHGGKARVLLVTSRDTGRWIIPKGWPMAGFVPAMAAAQEAWEEAGVEGRVDGASLGVYSYLKLRPAAKDVTCAVEVFPLRVDRLQRRYPERGERRRKWFAPEKAARKVGEPELRALILAFGEAAEQAAAGA